MRVTQKEIPEGLNHITKDTLYLLKEIPDCEMSSDVKCLKSLPLPGAEKAKDLAKYIRKLNRIVH